MPDEFTKDPSGVLDFSWDWSLWLAGGETISSATFSVSPAGLTLPSNSHTTNTATCWVSGGTLGQSYLLTCQVGTSASRTDDRSITIRIRQR